MNPILAPSKFSFGSSASNESSNSSTNLTLAPSKLAFRGLTASKLSSVTQTVCPNSKPADEANNDTKAAPSSKPSFIPLTLDSATKMGQTATSSAPTNTVPKESEKEKEPASSTASSTDPKPASSETFVFGQNLTDRAANFSNGTKSAESDDKEEQENELPSVSGAEASSNAAVTENDEAPKKSLTESAAEYCETRKKKPVEVSNVELITGEESEANVCQLNAKVRISMHPYQCMFVQYYIILK